LGLCIAVHKMTADRRMAQIIGSLKCFKKTRDVHSPAYYPRSPFIRGQYRSYTVSNATP
jgi:hypothetical protein